MVLSNPGKEDYETLILAAPTIDISEITGSNNAVKEEKAINSSKKMIQISEEALKKHSSLSKLANSTLKQLIVAPHLSQILFNLDSGL